MTNKIPKTKNLMTEFTASDLEQFKSRGITPDKVDAQIERFKTGFPYLVIDSPSSVGNGISALDEDSEKQCDDRWKMFLDNGGDVLKFVPASGAASRMFKALYAFVNGTADQPEPGSQVDELVKHIHEFAFIGSLEQTVSELYGKSVGELVELGRIKDLVGAIILPQGMNYGSLPKALLTFHRSGASTRTAMEEQLAEGAQTAASKGGKVRLHFTVSSDHRSLFENKIKDAVPAMEKRYGVVYDITLSEQKPSTDTVAVTPDNSLFRAGDGSVVFRPGGHGALIENLNDIDATVVFIKNIDNVVSDDHRIDTIRYKRMLGGMLLLVHDAIERHIAKLTDKNCTEADVDSACRFVSDTLCTRSLRIDRAADIEERKAVLLDILDRPLRVCGMVRNEGEPGGGPYNAWSSDGMEIAPQILESTQIDMSKESNRQMMAHATHFNPVDLVCYLRRHDGSRYSLPDYVDADTGFISEKSFDGRELRALELPGLWNGAMSRWNTVFVEVPATTFNPVKTVNDLLRPAHQ